MQGCCLYPMLSRAEHTSSEAFFVFSINNKNISIQLVILFQRVTELLLIINRCCQFSISINLYIIKM